MNASSPAEIRLSDGLGPWLDRYDGLILDLWGVVHDGLTPYPGVVETLEALLRLNKRVVMLTNAPRRAAVVGEAMVEMGIPPALYHAVMSSGEMSWHALKRRTDPLLEGFGRRCLLIGPERDRGLLDGLDLESVSTPQAGSFLLNTGPWQDGEQVADYEDLLQRACDAAMPMLCANPDIEVIRAGRRLICAGALAERFEAMGGRVVRYGKPFPSAYAACLDLMRPIDPRRILAVGDSLATDIRGARDAGLDSLLVTSGIHAAELGLAFGEPVDAARLSAVCRAAGLSPMGAIPSFRL